MFNFTQEQEWGIMYLLKLHNDQITAENDSIDERNRFIPRDQPLLEKKPLLTLEEFLDKKVKELATSGFQQLTFYKEQEALRLFKLKSPEEQAAILSKLQVPDVL